MSDRQVITFKVGESTVWMDHDAWKAEQNWFAMRNWMWEQHMFYGVPIGDKDMEKRAHEKFGIPMPEPTPSRLGHYFMADIGMMYKEGDLVFKISDTAYEPETEPFTGEWKYQRAISSFDF
jgi:hypothetical protein